MNKIWREPMETPQSARFRPKCDFLQYSMFESKPGPRQQQMFVCEMALFNPKQQGADWFAACVCQSGCCLCIHPHPFDFSRVPCAISADWHCWWWLLVLLGVYHHSLCTTAQASTSLSVRGNHPSVFSHLFLLMYKTAYQKDYGCNKRQKHTI